MIEERYFSLMQEERRHELERERRRLRDGMAKAAAMVCNAVAAANMVQAVMDPDPRAAGDAMARAQRFSIAGVVAAAGGPEAGVLALADLRGDQ